MPRVSRALIKAGMVFLLAGLVAGAAGPLGTWLNIDMLQIVPLSTLIHIFVVGWLTQLIFGVAYWMFPKYSKEHPMGSEALAWATFWCINAGLVLRVVAEIGMTRGGGDALRMMVVASAVLQWAGGMAFVANTWPRVRAS